jgi:hypothetical protein
MTHLESKKIVQLLGLWRNIPIYTEADSACALFKSGINYKKLNLLSIEVSPDSSSMLPGAVLLRFVYKKN